MCARRSAAVRAGPATAGGAHLPPGGGGGRGTMASVPVSIPGAPVDGDHPLPGPTAPSAEARPHYRILLVDDDPATLMAMKHHLVRMRGPVQYQGACWEWVSWPWPWVRGVAWYVASRC